MTCAACTHDEREDIDVRLAQGDSFVTISAMFGVARAVLEAHKKDHLRQVAVRIRSDPSSILLDLERAERAAWTVVAMAEGIMDSEKEGVYLRKPDPSLMLKALAEVRESKVSQVKMAKELAMFQKDVVTRQKFNEMVEAVLKALEAFPEAHEAVEAALAELPS